MRYAATVRADASGEITALFLPDQNDGVVGSGAWVAQLDDITHEACFAEPVVLSNFDASTDGWTSITATNSPFPAAFTSVSETGGELVLADGGFTGGALGTYGGAAPAAGIHVVQVDLRIVTDNGSLDRARVAACAGGPTTDYAALSFSQAFSTTGDDSGQAMQTVAVPVITDGAGDITVYVLADYDAGISSGTFEIRVGEVRIENPQSASTSLSASCGPGYHSLGGPVLSFPDAPALGSTFNVDGDNLGGLFSILFFGPEVPPVPLTPLSSIPGAQGCVLPLTNLTASGTASVSLPITIPNDPSFCGETFSMQWVDLDPNAMVPLPLGTSQAGSFTIGL